MLGQVHSPVRFEILQIWIVLYGLHLAFEKEPTSFTIRRGAHPSALQI